MTITGRRITGVIVDELADNPHITWSRLRAYDEQGELVHDSGPVPHTQSVREAVRSCFQEPRSFWPLASSSPWAPESLN